MKIKSVKKVQLNNSKQFYDVVECSPYHNFIVQTNKGNIISHNCNFSDEVNFSAMTNNVEKMKAKMLTIISQIDARMKSRFLRGTYLPTINVIASSKNSDQSFLDSYIETKKKNESTTTLIVDEPQWIVDDRKVTGEWFCVAIGNKFLANELLPKNAPKELIDEYKAKGYTILEVPSGYYENFQDNIDGALTDIAGIATASSLKYISGVRWNEIKTSTYQNPFTKEIIEVGNAKDDTTQYQDYFDLSRVPSTLKKKPMYIHLDMSMSGDKTGISGIYVIGKSPKIEGETTSKEMFYQVAFNVSVKAPKGYEISFDKHRAFIRWLKQQGFKIKGISCFKGDTLISTPTGLKAIKDIKVGDVVYAFDDITHSVVESKVYNSINNGPRKEFIKVWVSDDDYIECTPEHLIKTQRGYVAAIDLLDNDLIEVDDKLFYKQKLLRTNLFIDNEYLDQYIELIIHNKNNIINNYVEKHHILPKAIFKLLNMPLDNSELNMCNLSYSDHMLAHCILTKCTIEPFKSKAISAVTMMLSHNKYLPQTTIDDYLNNIELQLLVKECKSGRKHTQEEIDKIKKANKKPHNVHPKSEFKKGYTPWNAGISWSTIYSEEELKEKFSKNGEYIWITNGNLETQILNSEIIPVGYLPGRLELKQDTKQKISNTNKQKGIKPPAQKGYINYTDGTSTIRIFPGDIIPEGFYKGRTFNTSKIKSKNFLNSEKFNSIDFEEYKEFYLSHSVEETIEKFEITKANHKKLCKFYNFTKYNYERAKYAL